MRNSFLILSFAFVYLLAVGCESPSATKSEGKADMQSHEDHGHDRLEPTDYMAEWRHYKGNNVIRVYVLDSNKKTVAVDGTVSIQSESGKSKETFELVPEDAEQGKAGVFMLDEQALANAMNLGVVITFEIDGKQYSGKVPPHAPHHH